MNSDVELSLVTPIYNEEEVIPILCKKLNAFFAHKSLTVEWVVVNDGSTDQTVELLKDWQSVEPRLTVIRFPKNQGHQQALYAGLRAAKGNFIATIDADLQDPIEMIPAMIQKSVEGYDIIHMQRISRAGETIFKRFSAWVYYRIARIFLPSLLLDVGDFRLMTRKAINMYFSSQLPGKLLRYEITRLNCPQFIMTYKREKRIAGKSKYTLKKLFQLATAGLFFPRT